ncbi:MAG: hypothetical protein C5B59_12895 [Bacteroidetes bacterium]|nr:MAG: hypothetical protein C5B59_12895 [Bacteroidota bacterium]
MGDTPQGSEVDAQEVAQDFRDKAKSLHERDLTTTDRLNKFFDQPGAHYEGKAPEVKPDAPQPPVAESKPPEPVPSSKQTQTDQVQPQQPKAPDVATPQPKEEEHVLPEQASERTKEQFNKLLEENKRLKQEQRQYGKSVFDEVRPGQVEPQPQQVGPYPGYQPAQPQFFPPYVPAQVPQTFGVLPPTQVQDLTRQFVDQNGNVDVNGLNQALIRANQEAMLARQQAQITLEQVARVNQRITTYEEDQQVREAHAQFPEIDPMNKEGKFDPEMFKAVKDRLIANRVSHVTETLLQAAQAIASLKGPAPLNQAQVEEAAVEKFKQSQAERNQGPFETSVGSEKTGRQSVSFDEARKITRMGGIDNPALDARLRNAGVIS